ncbi:MAG: glutaminase A [Clostridia bacterium]|nr:glutaminase A [Clostridia bacterium]
MKDLLLDIMEKCSVYKACGAVAAYIPELSKADPEELGICIADGSGTICGVGDFEKRFTMQSIVKPIILLLALMDKGMERVRSLVGVESTGKPFDSFNYSDLALTGDHINPMVNTGAIALCSLLPGEGYGEKFDNLISLVRRLAKNADIEMDTATYLSESATGNKNRALAYLLKAYGLIECDAEGVVDLYFRACSIAVSCKDLSRIALVFANHGYDSETGEQIFPIEYAQYVNAMLTICGMYDGSGEFALNVGVPAKSGVGGGIMAIVPSRIGIGVYSPALDKKGNSYAGIKVMEMLSKTLGLGIF